MTVEVREKIFEPHKVNNVGEKITLLPDATASGRSYLETEEASAPEIREACIRRMGQECSHYRRIRGDNNCFYRALGYAFFEKALEHGDIERIQNLLERLNFGFHSLHDVAGQPELRQAQEDLKMLSDWFNPHVDAHAFNQKVVDDDNFDLSIVRVFRFATAAYILSNPEEFPMLLTPRATVRHILLMDKSDDSQADWTDVGAAHGATRIPFRIHQLMGVGNATYYDDQQNFPDDGEPYIHLFLKPGHYDMLYPRLKIPAAIPTPPAPPAAPAAPAAPPAATIERRSCWHWQESLF